MKLVNFVSIFLVIFLFVLTDRALGTRRRHPVIYIPGDGGSTLEAKLNKTQVTAITWGGFQLYRLSPKGRSVSSSVHREFIFSCILASLSGNLSVHRSVGQFVCPSHMLCGKSHKPRQSSVTRFKRRHRTRQSPSSLWNCARTSGWFRLWLDVYQLATTKGIKCWAENVKLVHEIMSE